MSAISISRRSFLVTTGATGIVAASGLAMPYYSRAQTRPSFTHGVQSGDVDTSSGMIWTRVDRPSRINFEVHRPRVSPTRSASPHSTPRRRATLRSSGC